MLTVASWFVPNLKDIHYSIFVEYCMEKSKYYCRKKEGKKALYWSSLASKYLIKRFELRVKRGS